MKRKTLLLTGMAISLFRLLLVAGWGILTGGRQTTGETENNIISQTSQPLMREFNFGMDYPYFAYKELENNTENPGYKTYKNVARVMASRGDNSGIEPVEQGEGMISYKIAANIGGEIVKKLCFFPEPEKYAAMIMLLGKDNDSFYHYCISDGDKNVRIYINSATGQVLKIECSTYFNIKRDDSIQNSLNIQISRDTMTQLLKLTNTDSYNMFYCCTPQITECTGEAVMGYYQYSLKAKMSNEKTYMFRYITTDNETFQLERFQSCNRTE